MISIRSAVAADAQGIGIVFDAAVSEGWKYLGELASTPIFPSKEWDKLVAEHLPPNALLVAVTQSEEKTASKGSLRNVSRSVPFRRQM